MCLCLCLSSGYVQMHSSVKWHHAAHLPLIARQSVLLCDLGQRHAACSVIVIRQSQSDQGKILMAAANLNTTFKIPRLVLYRIVRGF